MSGKRRRRASGGEALTTNENKIVGTGHDETATVAGAIKTTEEEGESNSIGNDNEKTKKVDGSQEESVQSARHRKLSKKLRKSKKRKFWISLFKFNSIC